MHLSFRNSAQCLVALAALLIAAPPADAQTQQERWKLARKRLVEESVAGAGVRDRRVLQSIFTTPRHEFVPFEQRDKAYFDMALPIGGQQTISSPFIVAYMTESLDTKPHHKVLEIGTGSGYQAAVLSPLVKDVYTIEIIQELGQAAAKRLKRLDYDNVHAKVGDGFKGWPEHAPFDRIIVTCSPERVPRPLVEQLREGGLMVIPVGRRYQQTLYLFRKQNGELKSEALRPTLFVPMTGTAESRRQVQPDGAKPNVTNGGFETLQDNRVDVSPGWYYQRQMEVVTSEEAPEGERYIKFRNVDIGRSAHVLQGLALDGRAVKGLEISGSVKTDNVRDFLPDNDFSTMAVTFYDQNRAELGTWTVGPLRGTDDWRQVRKRFRVPENTRECILRLGLFGSTGTLCFDDIRLRAIK